MTSPSIRRQREYGRREPILQPNFGGPVNMAANGPMQERVNWQERLEQGFQSRHAECLRNRGSRRQGQNEGIWRVRFSCRLYLNLPMLYMSSLPVLNLALKNAGRVFVSTILHLPPPLWLLT